MANESLVRQIQGLIQATRDGSAEWNLANPTTAVWQKMLPTRGMVATIIQKVPGPSGVSYLLTVRVGPNSVLTVNSSQMREFDSLLKTLFDAIEENQLNRGATILDELLKK